MICYVFTEERLDLNCLLIKLRGNVDPKLWYQFGMTIGVPKDVLEKFKGYDDEQCMIELADYWLINHPAKPTWSQICDAAKRFKPVNKYVVTEDMSGTDHELLFKISSVKFQYQHIHRISNARSLPTRLNNIELCNCNSKVYQISFPKICVSPSYSSKNGSATLNVDH